MLKIFLLLIFLIYFILCQQTGIIANVENGRISIQMKDINFIFGYPPIISIQREGREEIYRITLERLLQATVSGDQVLQLHGESNLPFNLFTWQLGEMRFRDQRRGVVIDILGVLVRDLPVSMVPQSRQERAELSIRLNFIIDMEDNLIQLNVFVNGMENFWVRQATHLIFMSSIQQMGSKPLNTSTNLENFFIPVFHPKEGELLLSKNSFIISTQAPQRPFPVTHYLNIGEDRTGLWEIIPRWQSGEMLLSKVIHLNPKEEPR